MCDRLSDDAAHAHMRTCTCTHDALFVFNGTLGNNAFNLLSSVMKCKSMAFDTKSCASCSCWWLRGGRGPQILSQPASAALTRFAKDTGDTSVDTSNDTSVDTREWEEDDDTQPPMVDDEECWLCTSNFFAYLFAQLKRLKTWIAWIIHPKHERKRRHCQKHYG